MTAPRKCVFFWCRRPAVVGGEYPICEKHWAEFRKHPHFDSYRIGAWYDWSGTLFEDALEHIEAKKKDRKKEMRNATTYASRVQPGKWVACEPAPKGKKPSPLLFLDESAAHAWLLGRGWFSTKATTSAGVLLWKKKRTTKQIKPSYISRAFGMFVTYQEGVEVAKFDLYDHAYHAMHRKGFRRVSEGAETGGRDTWERVKVGDPLPVEKEAVDLLSGMLEQKIDVLLAKIAANFSPVALADTDKEATVAWGNYCAGGGEVEELSAAWRRLHCPDAKAHRGGPCQVCNSKLIK